MNFTGNTGPVGHGFNNAGSQPNRGRGRGRGRGNSRGRGRGRGGGGRGGGGLKFADIVQFDTAVDAHVLQGREGIQALCCWEQNSTIFTGGVDGIVKMFDINNGTSTEQPEGKEVSALCIHGSWLFVGYVNEPNGMIVGFVKSYNFGTSPPEQCNFEIDASFPAAHRARVSSIVVGGDIVFTGGEDGAVRGWKLDGKQWKLIGTLGGETAHNCPVRKVAIVNNFLYTGAINGEVKVWNLSGQLQSQFQAHQDMVTGISQWTANGQSVLLTCSSDCTIKVWDLLAGNGVVMANAQPVYTYPPPQLQRKPTAITCMATHVLQNGTHILICGFANGSIQVFDLPDFRDLGFLSGHDRNRPITSLELVPSKSLIFVGSLNGKLNCFKFVA